MSRLQATRAWLQWLSSSPSSSEALSIPPPMSDSFEAVAMSNNPMSQSPEDQFLHWHQDMEKKQEEQARQLKELQDHVEHLQCENDLLQALVEKRHDLGGRDVQDSDQALHLIPRNRGKEPIIPKRLIP